MYWMISFAVFYILTETALSWNSSHHGQLSCPSLQCLLLPSNISLPATKQKTTLSHEINTWYPIPKSRVSFDQKRSRNGYSRPYFNKQEIRKTDGYIFENDFFYNQKDFLEKLNIKFLPLEDGYIAVRGFERKINDSSEEYAALFVVYAHSIRKNSRESVKITEKEVERKKENENVTCDRPDVCNFSILTQHLNSGTSKNASLSKDRKIVSIPIYSNTSIEMEIGKLDNNNYTVLIVPSDRFRNSTEIENYEMQTNIINLTISKNMGMIIKCGGMIFLNKSAENNIENFTEDPNSELKESRWNISLSDNSNVNFSMDYGHDNSFKNGNEGTVDDGLKISGTTTNNLTNNEEFTDTSTSVNIFKDNNFQNENFVYEETENTMTNEKFYASTNLPVTHDNYFENLNDKHLPKEYTVESNNKANNSEISNESNSTIIDDLYKYNCNNLTEFCETKILNTSLPIIATLQIITNKKDKDNKTILIIYIESEKLHKYSSLKEKLHFRNYTNYKENFERSSNIRKRNTDREQFSIWQNSNTKIVRRKDILIDNGFISRENTINNKFSRSPNRTLLNKTEETSEILTTMNYFSLILPKDNTERRNSSSQLFSNLERLDSYLPATISRINEEFNKKNTYKFRNKGRIQNQILENPDGADSAKSNHIAYENRNKRGITLPTLIQNKDSGENHSLLKKSELQIVERGLLDRHLSRWKRKISPGVMRLLRNDIKMSKICEMRDGCDEISDVFTGKGKSKYQRVHERKWEKSDSKEDMEYNLMYNYRFMKNKQNMSFLKNIKSNDSKNVQISANSTPKQSDDWLYLQHTYSIQKTSFNTPISINKDLNFTNHKIYNSTLVHKNSPEVNEFDLLSNYRNFKSHNNPSKHRSRGDYANNTAEEILGNYSKSKIFTSDSSKRFHSLENNSRERRSNPQFVPVMSYIDSSKLLNPQILPNQFSFQNIKAKKRNFSSSFSRNESNFQHKEVSQPFTFINQKNARENSNNFHLTPSNSEEPEYIKLIQMKNNPLTWYSDTWKSGRSSTNNFAPEYKWILFIPEDEFDQKKPATRNSVKSPLNVDYIRKTYPNPEREREGNDWEPDEWILMHPVTDHPKDHTPTSQNEQKPWDIINLPNTNPINPTTKNPMRKGVFGTTKEPLRKPTSYNRNRADRYPYHTTTIRPWSTGIRWQSNDWTISHNPWHNRLTTPMMIPMMGNMAGGD